MSRLFFLLIALWSGFTGSLLAHSILLPVEEGQIAGLPEKYEPASFDRKTGHIKIGKEETTLPAALLDLFPKNEGYTLGTIYEPSRDPGQGNSLTFLLQPDGSEVRYEFCFRLDALALLRAEIVINSPRRILIFPICPKKGQVIEVPEPDPLSDLYEVELPAFALQDVPVREAIDLFFKKLADTPLKDLSFRVIEEPEKLPGYLPEIAPHSKPPANWTQVRISEEFERGTVGEMLHRLLSAAGAKYELQSADEIWILPEGGTFEKLETQEFLNPPGFLKNAENAEEELLDYGIAFYQGSSVRFDAGRNRLIMTNTRSQLDLLENLVGPMGTGLPESLPPDLTTTEGKLRATVFDLTKLDGVAFKDAIVNLQARLAKTPAEGVTLRIIQEPEKLDDFKSFEMPRSTEKTNWQSTPCTVAISGCPAWACLEYLAEQANARLRVQGDEVWIYPNTGTFDPLVTREFRLAAVAGAKPEAADYRGKLAAQGMIFCQGSKATFYPHNGRLLVTNTQDQIDSLQGRVD